MESFFSENLWLIVLIIILSVWELVWKMIAFWKSARGSQLAWFVCIGIFNTAGILPIIYLLWFRKNKPIVQTP